MSDNDLITMAVAILCTYSIASFRRFYGAGWAEAVFKSLLFSVGQLFILFYVYKILLFVTVMAMI